MDMDCIVDSGVNGDTVLTYRRIALPAIYGFWFPIDILETQDPGLVFWTALGWTERG